MEHLDFFKRELAAEREKNEGLSRNVFNVQMMVVRKMLGSNIEHTLRNAFYDLQRYSAHQQIRRLYKKKLKSIKK